MTTRADDRSSAASVHRLARRSCTFRLAAAAAAPWWWRPAAAQGEAWPSQPIRVIVVYPSGGVSDAIARALAQRMAARLGVAVVVENRGGASGSAGIGALAQARPDGHTLAFSAITPLSFYPQLARVRYDPLRSIVPLVGVSSTPALLVGTPAFEGHDFSALMAGPRVPHPGLRWATTGVGTTGHMLLEQVRLATGIAVTHIPYKGGANQLTDALAGHFELLSTNVGPSQLSYIRAGKLKPLAVGAPARLASLPSVPTFAELGIPQANLGSLFGLFAPAGVPPARLHRLNVLVNELLEEPGMRELLIANDSLPVGGSSADFSQRIARESADYRRAIGAGHVKQQSN